MYRLSSPSRRRHRERARAPWGGPGMRAGPAYRGLARVCRSLPTRIKFLPFREFPNARPLGLAREPRSAASTSRLAAYPNTKDRSRSDPDGPPPLPLGPAPPSCARGLQSRTRRRDCSFGREPCRHPNRPRSRADLGEHRSSIKQLQEQCGAGCGAALRSRGTETTRRGPAYSSVLQALAARRH